MDESHTTVRMVPMWKSMEPGVCIVRVEPQPGHLVITVTSAFFVAHGFRPNRTGPSARCTDSATALAVVNDFLNKYISTDDANTGEIE
jgi:hypothetical protein